MADSYTHQHSARNALVIAEYSPRDINSFIWGTNGPDPLFFHQMYNPFRKYDLAALGHIMHNEKTGLFLRNMFRFAQTDTQKDYCLGFLCHYSLDSVIHPYINYITQSYGSPFNSPSGHSFFESALDSQISMIETGQPAAQVDRYCPEIDKMHIDQIVTLFKKSVDATYESFDIPREEYLKAFHDIKLIKNFFYSPSRMKYIPAFIIEKILGFEEGFVTSRIQPCVMDLPDFPFWKNLGTGLYSTENLNNILLRSDYLSAECIKIGLDYFNGIITLNELMEDIGNKSYETGLVVD